MILPNQNIMPSPILPRVRSTSLRYGASPAISSLTPVAQGWLQQSPWLAPVHTPALNTASLTARLPRLSGFTDCLLDATIPSLQWIKSGLIQTIIALDVLGIWIPRIGVSLMRGAVPYNADKDPELKTMPPWQAWRTGKWRQLKALNWPNLAEETNREFASGPGFYSICILSYLMASKFLFKAGELTGLSNKRMAHHLLALHNDRAGHASLLHTLRHTPDNAGKHVKGFLKEGFKAMFYPDAWPRTWHTHPLTYQGHGMVGRAFSTAQQAQAAHTTLPELLDRYAHFAAEVTHGAWQHKVVSEGRLRQAHQHLTHVPPTSTESRAYQKLMKEGLHASEKALYRAIVTLNETFHPAEALYTKDSLPLKTWEGSVGALPSLNPTRLPVTQLFKERQALGDLYHTYLTHAVAGKALNLPQLHHTVLHQKANLIAAGFGLNIAMLFGLAWMSQRHAQYPANRLRYAKEISNKSQHPHGAETNALSGTGLPRALPKLQRPLPPPAWMLTLQTPSALASASPSAMTPFTTSDTTHQRLS